MSKDYSEDPPTPTPPSGSVLSPLEMSRMIREMHKALTGDPYDPKKPGLIKLYYSMHTDVYGNKEDGIKGLRDKVEKMWMERTKILGAVALISILYAILEIIIEFKK